MGRPDKQRARTRPGWWLVGYAFVLGLISIGLVERTVLWWLLPLFGLGALIAIAALDRFGGRGQENELIAAIQSRGRLTPAEAALQTSLTTEQARKLLEKLAQSNHLQQSIEEETVYELCIQDRSETLSKVPGNGESLSVRETEVLSLLSRGRTNSEISVELFVSVGTVKTHVNNIYRKLEVRNRTEAVSKARELNLLG